MMKNNKKLFYQDKNNIIKILGKHYINSNKNIYNLWTYYDKTYKKFLKIILIFIFYKNIILYHYCYFSEKLNYVNEVPKIIFKS